MKFYCLLLLLGLGLMNCAGCSKSGNRRHDRDTVRVAEEPRP